MISRAILILISCWFSGSVWAQETPSQAELDQMLKEMQGAMQDMDPEAKAAMDSMGLVVPDLSKIQSGMSGLSNANIQQMMQDDASKVPVNDPTRIALARSITLNEANLPDFIGQVQQGISQRLGSSTMKTVDDIYTLISQADNSATSVAHNASGLWMYGAVTPAVYIMGKACQADPEDCDNLNNYAAFLTMTGAEEAALPVLAYLNKKYPGNSTVLNNIGQAWFGLGDLRNAQAYLDSATTLFPGHSQANFTKALIEESKGNKTKAIDLAEKSLETGYSPAKERFIKDLGGKGSSSHIRFSGGFADDPMGLTGFIWPKYPMNLDESRELKPQWESFRALISEKMDELNIRMQKAEKEYMEALEKQTQEMLHPKTNIRLPEKVLFYSAKAQAKLDIADESESLAELNNYEAQLAGMDELQAQLRQAESMYEKNLLEVEANYGSKIGEGMTAADKAQYCSQHMQAANAYLKETNTILEKGQLRWIEYWQKATSKRLNYLQYTLMPTEAFEMEKLRAQITFLGLISGQQVNFEEVAFCKDVTELEVKQSGKLPDFDEMNCKVNSQMDYVIGTITITCKTMTTTINGKIANLSITQDLQTDRILKGTADISISLADFGKTVKSFTKFEKALGPVKAEVSAKAGAFIEFDEDQITDFGLQASAGAGIKTNIDQSIKEEYNSLKDPELVKIAGVNARIGWNSGGSLEGKGILSGIKYNSK